MLEWKKALLWKDKDKREIPAEHGGEHLPVFCLRGKKFFPIGVYRKKNIFVCSVIPGYILVWQFWDCQPGNHHGGSIQSSRARRSWRKPSHHTLPCSSEDRCIAGCFPRTSLPVGWGIETSWGKGRAQAAAQPHGQRSSGGPGCLGHVWPSASWSSDFKVAPKDRHLLGLVQYQQSEMELFFFLSCIHSWAVPDSWDGFLVLNL